MSWFTRPSWLVPIGSQDLLDLLSGAQRVLIGTRWASGASGVLFQICRSDKKKWCHVFWLTELANQPCVLCRAWSWYACIYNLEGIFLVRVEDILLGHLWLNRIPFAEIEESGNRIGAQFALGGVGLSLQKVFELVGEFNHLFVSGSMSVCFYGVSFAYKTCLNQGRWWGSRSSFLRISLSILVLHLPGIPGSDPCMILLH
jgi:hypothetical protein